MADVQSHFLTFHSNIYLSDTDENANLREKREIIVEALEVGLAKQAEAQNELCFTFTHFNQGSYALGTGIKPKDGDYDIDVGIVFNNTRNDFESPAGLKKIVRDAIDTNNRTVNIRRPCVTVTYVKNGQTDYHVDLAIYVQTASNLLDLSVGREYSAADNQSWQQSDPKGLITVIKDRHSGDDAKQFRRVIRYLKKWREEKFSGPGAPISIGLTCAAYHWFSPTKFLGAYIDLRALNGLVDAMLNQFAIGGGRLITTLPVTPHENLFAGMTDAQMETFREQLIGLQDALQKAQDAESTIEACKILSKQFGTDFEVPDGDDGDDGPSGTAKRSSVAPFVTTGHTAKCKKRCGSI